MNPRLDSLHAYPFERLKQLFAGIEPARSSINLGIGEPQHSTPSVVTEALSRAMPLLGKYPPTAGTPELKQAIVEWIYRRYRVSLTERQVLPVAGSREALFAFAQAVLDPQDPGVVLIPNPFYQIYEGAAIVAGATPFYVPATSKPDWSAVPNDVWPKVRLVYVCTPGNPSGTVLGLDDWREIFALADRYGFIVASDECYSEIYNGKPPVGALEAAKALGRSFERLVVFNSLSKRSSCPGLRSGFVAGDAEILGKFLLYRTYQGCAPSLVVQAASASAWQDEAHVDENRRLYQAKFEAVREILKLETLPEGGFFVWYPVVDDEAFAKTLFAEEGVTVLPGRYLGRDAGDGNPGQGRVRIALVPPVEACVEAAARIARISGA